MKETQKIPKEAQEHIDFLTTYKVNEKLDTCNLVHMYDSGEFGALPNGDSQGFVDSKLFDVWCYDFDKKEKCKREGKDMLWLQGKIPVDQIRIFADGSTLVRFKYKIKIGWEQALNFDLL